jgi:hypothetical protein
LAAFHLSLVELLNCQELDVWKRLETRVDEYNLRVFLSLRLNCWRSKSLDHEEGDVADVADLVGFVEETGNGGPSQISRPATLPRPQMLKEASLQRLGLQVPQM